MMVLGASNHTDSMTIKKIFDRLISKIVQCFNNICIRDNSDRVD
jgi:hypothetical protein